jgi:hypothetical protein
MDISIVRGVGHWLLGRFALGRDWSNFLVRKFMNHEGHEVS